MKPRAFAGCLAVMLAVRLYWAATVPLANDEAYYWDWARAPALSYLDHPPGIAWLAWAGEHLAQGTLGARLLVPFVQLLAVLFLAGCARWLKGSGQKPAALSTSEAAALLVLTQLVPVFSLEGVLLLPDSGLLLALAAALYTFIRADAAAPGRALRWAVPAGLALGLAGLFKYHAAPIALGLGLGLLWRGVATQRAREFFLFLAVAAPVAVLATLPVWWWNAAHEFASFRFQGSHGFDGLGFSPLSALRVYFGQAVMLSPLLFFAWIKLLRPRGRDLLPLAGFLPLFALLEVLAFGKQLLPHWAAPAFWLLVPVVALRPWPGRLWRWNAVFAGVLTLGVPWILSIAPIRQALVASFHGKPGPLAELTLWAPLAEALTADPRLAPLLAAAPDSAPAAAAGGCPQPVTLASLRWFWSAQLAFHLPGQPRVLSLDFNHPSYYSFRDDLSAYGDCPVLILADARHLDPALLGQALASWERLDVVVPSHADVPVVALSGRFRTRAELEALTGPAPVY